MTDSAWTLVAILFGLTTILYLNFWSSSRRKPSPSRVPDPQHVERLTLLRAAEAKMSSAVSEHIDTLARRRGTLIHIDDYGLKDTSKWDQEIGKFIDGVVNPRLTYDEHIVLNALVPQWLTTLRQMIEDRARGRAEEVERALAFSPLMTPVQFERWCAKRIQECGWRATLTVATGDQGADVVADRDGLRVVLQCKLYSGAVGNKAVQEAYAAQRHYRAHASAVVTNATFTASARILAASTGVHLLHYSDLSRLGDLCVAGSRLP